MTLDQFLSSYTGEDNASFEVLLEASNARKRAKVAHHLEGKDAPLLLEGPSPTDEYGTSGQAPSSLVLWKFTPKNRLYYDASQQAVLEYSAKERAAMVAGPPKGVRYAATRVAAETEEEQQAQLAAAGLAAGASGSDDDGDGFPGAAAPEARGDPAEALAGGRAAPAQRGAAGARAYLRTPTIAPGAGASPLVTWGDVAATPLRLVENPEEDWAALGVDPGGGEGPQFRLPQVRRREAAAKEVFEKKKAAAFRRRAAGGPAGGSATPVLDSLRRAAGAPLSSAGQRLATQLGKGRLAAGTPSAGVRGGGSSTGLLSDAALQQRLRASYSGTPGGAPRAGPWLLTPTTFDAARDVDKAFCSAWISPDSVLVGTKCNSLLLVDVVTRRHRRVALPPKPAVRQAPELMYNPDGHCGMHAMDVSPDGRYVVTGGRAAEDAVVLRRDTLTPVQTFSGHADWIFGLAWVTESHFVSGSRDGTIKLWAVVEPEDGGYAAESTAPLASVLENKRTLAKQRDIKCWVPDGRIVSLGVDGTVVLEGARELACLAVQDRLVAAGSRFHIHLLDLRQRCAAAGTIPLTDNGVRSLQLAGHVLSAGTGDAGVAFFDLRYLRRAKGPRLRDLTPGGAGSTGGVAGRPPARPPVERLRGSRRVRPLLRWPPERADSLHAEDDPFDAERGHQPLELGHLQLPLIASTSSNTSGWEVRETVYTHSWDASGTRLFMAGGPLAVGNSGCAMSAWL
ncbi:WD repeat-containing protein 40A [Monoraphidium neglectum]|uniref:WD repeat-containing protein 40A n=1 Tax=Monoraphidium neglectum TaxID=145388 RepID=A0A0D2MV16_9CHLO|nr:WD repeat-containing protein 40A [Monoraphidium neglectum]KIZ04367.1 WD repeat-containing protein 40A [Monoraphidium neglectum]|eukprot:XP_013903386.1 WD repeat-containing protein 40A [Monoraphidium neglectum]